MANRPHLFLLNPSGQKKHFNASRSFDAPELPEPAPENYRRQKDKLSQSFTLLNLRVLTPWPLKRYSLINSNKEGADFRSAPSLFMET
jgi:hypothetical protein